MQLVGGSSHADETSSGLPQSGESVAHVTLNGYQLPKCVWCALVKLFDPLVGVGPLEVRGERRRGVVQSAGEQVVHTGRR